MIHLILVKEESNSQCWRDPTTSELWLTTTLNPVVIAHELTHVKLGHTKDTRENHVSFEHPYYAQRELEAWDYVRRHGKWSRGQLKKIAKYENLWR